MSPRITFRKRGPLAGFSNPRPRICTFTRTLVLHIKPRTEVFRSFLKDMDTSRGLKCVSTDREDRASVDMLSMKRPFRVAFPKAGIQPQHDLTNAYVEDEEEEEDEEKDEWQEDEEEEQEDSQDNENNNEPRCHLRLKRRSNKPNSKFYYPSNPSPLPLPQPHGGKSTILVFKRIHGTGRKKNDSFCGELSCRVCGPFIRMWVEDLERGNPLLLGGDAPSSILDREGDKENIRYSEMDVESATESGTGTGDEPTVARLAQTKTKREKRDLLPEVQYRLSCLEVGYDPLTFKAKGSRGTDGTKPKLVPRSVPHVGVGTRALGRRTNNSLAAAFDEDARMAGS